jgi:hypothetical protein
MPSLASRLAMEVGEASAFFPCFDAFFGSRILIRTGASHSGRSSLGVAVKTVTGVNVDYGTIYCSVVNITFFFMHPSP